MVSFFTIGTCILFGNSIQKADADTAPTKKYFNPEIPYPQSPCDTGGNSICVDW